MKKLISAASALAMAASMAGAVIPFTTGAADATKGFELRAFTNKAGEVVSTNISTEEINAGDVTIPIAVYVNEKTNDSKSIVAQWTVDSKDGDASNANVTFAPIISGTQYFDSPRTVTLADGSTVETDLTIGFSGTITAGKKGTTFDESSSNYGYNTADKQVSWNCPNAWGSVVWVTPNGGYTWTGETSDAFPIFVFEATFKKGTPAGTYSINFLEAVDDSGVPATYFEAGTPTVKHTVEKKNIDLKGIDIVIGDAATPGTTTATPKPITTAQNPPTTTAATTAAPNPSTTTIWAGEGELQPSPIVTDEHGVEEVNDKFIVRGKKYTAKPGEDIEVAFEVDTGDSYVSTMRTEFADLPAGITVEMKDFTCYADADLHKWEFMNGFSYQIKTLTKAGNDPAKLLDKDTSDDLNNDVMQVIAHIPDDIAPGTYNIAMKFFEVCEYGQVTADHEISMFNAITYPAQIVIEGDAPGTTTAKNPPATTAAPTTAKGDNPTTAAPTTAKGDTPTTAAPKPTDNVTGTPLYGDTNCDKDVNIADVVVLNKWLNDAKSYNISAQGKLNADCCDEKGGEGLDKNDSDAIIRSIVHLVELPCTSADLK